jgi:hypothetical protein
MVVVTLYIRLLKWPRNDQAQSLLSLAVLRSGLQRLWTLLDSLRTTFKAMNSARSSEHIKLAESYFMLTSNFFLNCFFGAVLVTI